MFADGIIYKLSNPFILLSACAFKLQWYTDYDSHKFHHTSLDEDNIHATYIFLITCIVDSEAWIMIGHEAGLTLTRQLDGSTNCIIKKC